MAVSLPRARKATDRSRSICKALLHDPVVKKVSRATFCSSCLSFCISEMQRTVPVVPIIQQEFMDRSDATLGAYTLIVAIKHGQPTHKIIVSDCLPDWELRKVREACSFNIRDEILAQSKIVQLKKKN